MGREVHESAKRVVAALMALALGGCGARFHACQPSKYVYGVGYGDYLSASGPTVSRQLAATRAEREVAKQVAINQVRFCYTTPGQPQSVDPDSNSHIRADVLDVRVVGDSVRVTVAAERTAETLALIRNIDEVARASASSRAKPLSAAYNVAFREALGKIVEAFRLDTPGDLPQPLTGQATLVSVDVEESWLWGVKLTIEAYVEFSGRSSIQAKSTGDSPTKEAQSLRDENRPDLAAKRLRQAIELDPANTEYYHDLGQSYYAMQEFGPAGWAYGMAASLAPTNVQYQVGLGLCLEMRGDMGGARLCYAKAVALDADCQEAQAALQRLRRSQGDQSPTAPQQ